MRDIDRTLLLYRCRHWWNIARFLMIISLLAVNGICIGDDNEQERAFALLRGVAAARNRFETFVWEFTEETRLPDSPEVQTKWFCLVEQIPKIRRFEILPESTSDQSVCLFDAEGVTFEHRYGRASDLHVYSREIAKRRGILAFDPRIIGLTTVHSFNTNVEECFWLHEKADPRIVGQESINNVMTTKIELKAKQVTSTYWISEPGFRVHRRTIRWEGGGHASVDSEYDAKDPKTVFPNKVVIHNRLPKFSHDVFLSIKRHDLSPEIDPERFSLESFDLPVNTMISDYRIKKITGYWNGTGISDNPVQIYTPVLSPPKK